MSFLQGQFNPLLVFLAILVFLVILVIIFCEDIKVSQTAQYEGARLSEVKYPVAVSNRLFKDSEIIKDLPCQHCNMISWGEMACYQEFCPECGRIPPILVWMFGYKKKSVTFEEIEVPHESENWSVKRFKNR